MSYTIALAGKGGVGKTTTCGLIIDYLCKAGKGPILAVDADANSNLNEVLGEEIDITIGDIREEMTTAEMQLENPIPKGMTKQEYANVKFNDALIEAEDYDMLVMGRTQGQGCYCYVNGVLKSQIDKFSKNYNYVIVDNEAGMEHISRGILPTVDAILLVSDCSRRGVQAAARIKALAESLNIKPKYIKLIVNRAPGGVLNDGLKEEISKHDFNLAGVIPQDETVYEYDTEGRPIVDLPEDSPVKKAVAQIMADLGL